MWNHSLKAALVAVTALALLGAVLVALVYGADNFDRAYIFLVLAGLVSTLYAVPQLNRWVREVAASYGHARARSEADLLKKFEKKTGLAGDPIDLINALRKENDNLVMENVRLTRERDEANEMLVAIGNRIKEMSFDSATGTYLSGDFPTAGVLRRSWLLENFEKRIMLRSNTASQVPALKATIASLNTQVESLSATYEEIRKATADANERKFKHLESQFELFKKDLDAIVDEILTSRGGGAESPAQRDLREKALKLEAQLAEMAKTIAAKDETISSLERMGKIAENLSSRPQGGKPRTDRNTNEAPAPAGT